MAEYNLTVIPIKEDLWSEYLTMSLLMQYRPSHLKSK